MKAHPTVKQIANFWGIITITGRNIVNAMKTRNMPLARNRAKYMRDFPDETVLVVDLKLPLTPFETLETLKLQKTISKTY
jgi:hypothetical protein